MKIETFFQQENVTIEVAENWTKFIIPHVPIHIKAFEGSTLVICEMIKNEFQTIFSTTPLRERLILKKLGQYTESCLIHLKQKLNNLRFRLFN